MGSHIFRFPITYVCGTCESVRMRLKFSHHILLGYRDSQRCEIVWTNTLESHCIWICLDSYELQGCVIQAPSHFHIYIWILDNVALIVIRDIEQCIQHMHLVLIIWICLMPSKHVIWTRIIIGRSEGNHFVKMTTYAEKDNNGL